MCRTCTNKLDYEYTARRVVADRHSATPYAYLTIYHRRCNKCDKPLAYTEFNSFAESVRTKSGNLKYRTVKGARRAVFKPFKWDPKEAYLRVIDNVVLRNGYWYCEDCHLANQTDEKAAEVVNCEICGIAHMRGYTDEHYYNYKICSEGCKSTIRKALMGRTYLLYHFPRETYDDRQALAANFIKAQVISEFYCTKRKDWSNCTTCGARFKSKKPTIKKCLNCCSSTKTKIHMWGEKPLAL